MKYLNLTEGFNPYNAEEKDCIKFESFFFNGGEPHIKINIDDMFPEVDVMVTSRLRNMNEFMMLMVATDALFNSGYLEKRYLFIPYFPGARQDRKMIEGEPLTVKVFADIMNKFEYNEVIIFDPHSDVAPALINNCTIINNHNFVENCLDNIYTEFNKPFQLISPDAGTNKKINNLGKYLNPKFPFFVTKCDKERDISNGNISGFEVYNTDIEGRDCIIVDDICDGGGTFIGLAEELKKKNAGDLYLVVSHGIFSKGFKELRKHFKAIYTTDSWVNDYAMEIPEHEKGSEIVNIINFKNFI